MKNIFPRISFIVHEKQILSSANTILSGISGGQDSIVLFLILMHLNYLWNFPVHLIYCNHFWQKKNFYTLIEVFKFSYLFNKNIHITVPKTSISSENTARLWRKKNFYQIANFLNLNTLILAHSATDQLETSFWHLCRGTSPSGLLSLKENSNFNLQNDENYLVPIKIYTTKKTNKIISSNLIFWSLKVKQINQKRYLNSRNTYLNPNKKKIFLQNNTLILYENYITKQSISKKHLASYSSTYCDNKIINYYNFRQRKSFHIEVKRPLIIFYRSVIKKIAIKSNLPIITDETNISLKIIRNKIRLLIFPLLRKYIHQRTDFHLKNYIDITISEQKYFTQLTHKVTAFYCNNPTLVNSIWFLPKGVKMALIKNIIERYSGKQIKKKQIEKILIIANKFNKKIKHQY